MEIKVLTMSEDILGANDEKARNNRILLDRHGILSINVMASPGAGKTSLIMHTIGNLKDRAGIAVIEGDIATDIDATAIHKEGIPVVQINTAGGCHLDANMIEKGLNNLPLEDLDLLLIENVGNLVCPAEFNLGEHKRVMLLSTPEGDDKPHKYPLMFTEADVVLLNKVDLLPHVDFDVNAFKKAVTGLNPDVTIFQISCKTELGLGSWFSWLQQQMLR